MAFQDFDLTEQVAGKHELWDINETVNLTSVLYRLKDLEKEVGRNGYGLDVGLRGLFLQFFHDRSDRQMEQDLRFNPNNAVEIDISRCFVPKWAYL